MTYIEVKIKQTCKRWGTKDSFTVGGEENRKFPSMKEAREFLTSRYGKARREPMYCDLKDGRTVQSGYVYRYSETEYFHQWSEKWICHNWVSIHEIHISYPLSEEHATGTTPARM